jgi:fructoselysine-6-P-deglycase FrlB-like protein
MTETTRAPVAVPAELRQVVADVVSRYPQARRIVASLPVVDTVYLIGCGASHFASWPVHLLLQRYAPRLACARMTSIDFCRTWPARLGPASLVVASAHSGNTSETVAAAGLAKDAGATVIAVTSQPASPLGAIADAIVDYPSTGVIAEPKLIALSQLGHVLLERFGEPLDHGSVRDAFLALPDALVAVKDEVAPVAARVASTFGSQPLIYVLGAGSSYGVACATAMCYLQEMLWKHAVALDAGDFFHGPLEVVTDETPILVLHGEDESRRTTDRVLAFARRVGANVEVVDAMDFSLPGVPRHMRSLVSPIALTSAARRLLDYLAAENGHNTSQRRYLGRPGLPQI